MSDWWTLERIEQLRRLWADGLSSKRIADQMRTTKNAIVGKAHRLGLPSRPSPIRVDPNRPPAPPPKPRPLPTDARNTLAQLGVAPAPEPPPPAPPPPPRRGSCQWPIGEPRTPGFRVCGQPLCSHTRMPYCAQHAARARRPTSKPDDAA